MKRIYLDYCATTPAHPDVVKEMLSYFTDAFGNPSSVHSCGQGGKDAIEEARGKVAGLIGARGEEIVFTSGGTDANEKKGNHIIISPIEHHAVVETAKFLEWRGFEVTRLPVDEYGMVDPDEVKKAITGRTVLISVMHANNEIGTIEPIAEIGKVAREAGVYFHTDAVQTVGHIPVDVEELGVDMLSLSGHKLYGPKGVGALYIRKGTRITPFMHGGGQEKGRRASTENVPGIVGLGKAADIAGREMGGEVELLTRLRGQLIDGLLERIDHIRLNGHPSRRLPNNINLCIDFVEGESMVLKLDLEGICASTGSACSSANLEPSHVLLATGVPPEQAHGSLRLTMGRWTVEDDISRILETLPRIVAELRGMSPLLKTRGDNNV